MFSARTAWRLDPNRLHQLAAARRAQGALLDLTVSNPTLCGFDYPAVTLPPAPVYQPDPCGLASAREAIAAHEPGRAPHGRFLTASTSEAYGLLFRLLCDPCDAVVMPTPSYPLFDMLARAHDVELVAAPMEYAGGWHLDFAALDAAPARTRALLVVHPNNPAGNYLKPAEWSRLQALAASRGWAVVVDEVFRDFPVELAAPVDLALDPCPAPTFVLNGLSKLAALPQMKLAWIAVYGPQPVCAEACARLEILNDLLLSASTPVQLAAESLLAVGRQLQPQIQHRLRGNLRALDRALAAHPAVGRLRIEGGWTAILRLPLLHPGEEWAERLCERAGVLTHPGHFYNDSDERALAISLLPPPAQFAEGIERLLQETHA